MSAYGGAIVLASGELRFRPQSFSYCGHCDQYFMSCTCHGIPHAHDFNFKCLPRPPDGSTPQMLLRRWCSCVAQSSSMGRFEALKWYRDHSSAKLRAMANKRDALNDMVEEYVARLPSDPHLPLLAKAIGIRGAPAEGAPRLAREARSAAASFVAGDWATVTRVGAICCEHACRTSHRRSQACHASHRLSQALRGAGEQEHDCYSWQHPCGSNANECTTARHV